MEYIIRIKAVSSCIGIRRSNLCYIRLADKSYDLTALHHPMSSFKKMTLDGLKLRVVDQEHLLKPGYEEFYYKTNEVKSLNKTVSEECVLGALLIPLDIKMDKIYNDAINEGETFDQWPGEFEFLLSLLYEYEMKDHAKAIEYKEKALAKGFKFNILD